MACFVEQVTYAPTREKQLASHDGVVVYSLTSGADGDQLTGTGEVCVVNSDAAGWFRVSNAAATKAAVQTNHRVLANVTREIGGVKQGDYISFLNDV